MKFLDMILRIVVNLRNIVILIILTRLFFLENMPAASVLEILSGITILLTTPIEETVDPD